MTIKSLQLLAHFLNTFKPKGRIADYGGTDKIGERIVKRLLALDNISIKKVEIDKNSKNPVDGHYYGDKKKVVPKYFALDFDNGINLLEPIKGEKFDCGICMDLLEHCENPFIVAKNISDSLKPGAPLFLTAPWIWEVHNFPNDFWRFCPQGLEVLFPDMEKITIETIRDAGPEEEVTRTRLVAVFIKKK